MQNDYRRNLPHICTFCKSHIIKSHGVPIMIADLIGDEIPSVPGWVERTAFQGMSLIQAGASSPRYFVSMHVPNENPIPYIGASGKRLQTYIIAFLISYVAPALQVKT